MTSNELKELVKSHFSLVEATTETFGEIKDINGAFTLIFEGDVLEVGKEVKVRTTEGQELSAPDGVHELEDGMKIRTEGSKVVEIMEAEAPAEEMVEVEEPVEVEKMATEEEAMEEIEVSIEPEEEVAPMVEEVVKAVIEAVKDEVESMKKELGEMKKRMEAIEDKPAAEKAMPSMMSADKAIKPTEEVFNKDRFEAVMARFSK